MPVRPSHRQNMQPEAEAMMHAVRKDDHLRINLEKDVEIPDVSTGFEKVRLRHAALPELDFAEVDTSIRFLNRTLALPLLISSMTGGTAQTQRINLRLAHVAQAKRIAMGVGSQRIMVEEQQSLADWRALRQAAPDIPLLANLGIVQLNRGFDEQHCRLAVEMIEADALILHCNPLQECVQAGGDRDWRNLLAKLETVCTALPVPVIVKEVGWGIDGRMAQRILEAGAAGVDVAGTGGTSWSEVEMHRADSIRQARIAAAFREWGLPTACCLRDIAATLSADVRARCLLIASGGMRSGIEVAKALAMGADLAGVAGPFLRCAAQSAEALLEEIGIWQEVLAIAMLCSGSKSVSALRRRHVLVEI